MDYSPQGPKEWDTTECAHTHIDGHTLYLAYRFFIKTSKIIIDENAFHAINYI